MRAWMNECLYKEIVGVGNVTLMTRVIGFEELLSDMSNQDPRSLFMTELARPTRASFCSLPVSRRFAKAVRSTQEAHWSLLAEILSFGPF